jgi:hypothetical protein
MTLAKVAYKNKLSKISSFSFSSTDNRASQWPLSPLPVNTMAHFFQSELCQVKVTG